MNKLILKASVGHMLPYGELKGGDKFWYNGIEYMKICFSQATKIENRKVFEFATFWNGQMINVN